MGRAVGALLFALVGGATAGLAILFGGYFLVKAFKPDDSAGWGMLIPMVFTPLGTLAGVLLGGWTGWRRG